MSEWPDWALAPTPGVVYRHYDHEDVLLYIGSSDVVRYESRQDDHAKGARWWPYVARISSEEHPSRRCAYLAEFAAISAERPIFNRLRSRMIPWQEEREFFYVEIKRRELSWAELRRPASLEGVSA